MPIQAQESGAPDAACSLHSIFCMNVHHAAAASILIVAACTDLGPDRVDAPVDSAAGEVEFTLAGPGGAALIVPVHLNGSGPYEFVLDTGATVTCVDDDLAGKLQLENVRNVGGVAAGIGGQGQLRLVHLDSIRIGEAVAHQLQACVVDLANLQGVGLEIDGLVGLNMLTSFRVTLDFQRNVVTLEQP